MNSKEMFEQQPTLDFIEELKKPLHTEKPVGFGTRKHQQDEVDLNGSYLDIRFPDNKGTLQKAYEDFQTFLNVYGIAGNAYRITVMYEETGCFEEYSVSVAPNGCVITSADTEGIRRALIYLEDCFIESEAAYLKPGKTKRRPFVKTRITRGFFSPTNRPPKNIDELYDDTDYYPDEYLNRIAHDGNNGIWIYTHFSDLIASSVISEYGTESERRIQKLQKVVKKCAQYGIKVYLFAVEPECLSRELAHKYAGIIGRERWDGRYTFCTNSELGEQYCIEATEWLFRKVPDLGGLIDITSGERATNCLCADYENCPRCSKYKKGEILAHTADLFKEGMRRAGSGGEFISWTYNHREWERKDIYDYVKAAPDDVMLMQNFDDYGFSEQLGKKRFAMDYWLSYAGPSELFEDTANYANETGKHLYAKMQVCCSHELATVPYIPVPALLFQKYAAAYRLRVEGIVQCWYFGNYPSMMSKAAGELSFTEDFSDEHAFLLHLAGILYGKSHAEAIAKAWQYFSDGYKHYPINIMFSYYGPMHDGVVWKLHLLPKNIPPARTWLLLEESNGDRICDALGYGHTLEETILLSEKICENWNKGLRFLPKNGTGEDDILAESLGVLFDSGKNILKFYALRDRLGRQDGNLPELLKELKEIVLLECHNSRRMIELCEKSPSLGYHSEAEAFKFYPAKLQERIDWLEELLKTEFLEVERRIADGKVPLAYYEAEGEDCYQIGRKPDSVQWNRVGKNGAFSVWYDKNDLYLDIKCEENSVLKFCFEGKIMFPSCEMIVENGRISERCGTYMHKSVVRERVEEELSHYRTQKNDWGYRIIVSRQHIGWTDDTKPMKLMLKIDEDSWITEESPSYRLGNGIYSAGEFGWIRARNEI